jgi:WD40 repeat protein
MLECPYKGLAPYSEEDAPFFFGRRAETEIITANLTASRLTLLYGASGVGKSSVIQAGVARRLRQEALDNVAASGRPEIIPVIFGSWHDDPVKGFRERVKATVRGLCPDAIPDPPPVASLTDALEHWIQYTQSDLLIVLDQFEEYFLYHPQEDGEGTFAVELPRAVNRPGLRVNFLLAIREDCLSLLDRFKGRIPDLFANYLRIDHLDNDSAREAITGPVQQWNKQHPDAAPIGVEPALTAAVLEQVQAGKVVLAHSGQAFSSQAALGKRVETPYLQLVMSRIWQEDVGSGSTLLRLQTLDRLGGATRLVRTHLDESMERLSRGEREIAARVFHHLVTRSGTKIAHGVADLAEYADVNPRKIGPLLTKLAGTGHRILRGVAPPPDRPGAVRYEIAHDVLAAAVLDWRARRIERKRRRKLLLWVAGSLVVCLGSLVALSAFIVWGMFVSSRDQARESINKLDSDPELSLMLALNANSDYSTDESNDALQRAVNRSYMRLTINKYFEALSSVVYVDRGAKLMTAGAGVVRAWDTSSGVEQFSVPLQNSAVHPMISNRDGSLLAVGDGKSVKVLDARSGALRLEIAGHTAPVGSVAFSPDGSLLATSGFDNRLKLWLTVSGKQILDIPVESGPAGKVIFSPSGSHVATVVGNRTVVLYKTRSGRRAVKFDAQLPGVLDLALSPDGTRLATAGGDRSLRLWEASTGKELLVMTGHLNRVTSVDFDPSGARILSGSADGTARVWDLASGRMLYKFAGHRNTVTGVAFSPDNSRVATASIDGTARIWEAPPAHRDHVMVVSISPDTGLLASGSWDGTAKVWNVIADRGMFRLKEIQTLAVSTAGVAGVSFTGGNRVAANGFDNSVVVWDLKSGRKLLHLQEPQHHLVDSVMSADGRLLAATDSDGQITLWDLNLGVERRLPASVRGHRLAIRHDGVVLAGIGGDSLIRLWDTGSAKLLRTLTVNSDNPAWSLAFSADGKRLAAGHFGGSITIWDVASGNVVMTLAGHGREIVQVTFSADGKRLASAAWDTSAKVWDLSTGNSLATYHHDRAVLGVAFSRDGTFLATPGDGIIPHIYSFDFDAVQRFAQGRVKRSFTPQECFDYFYFTFACPSFP